MNDDVDGGVDDKDPRVSIAVFVFDLAFHLVFVLGVVLESQFVLGCASMLQGAPPLGDDDGDIAVHMTAVHFDTSAI